MLINVFIVKVPGCWVIDYSLGFIVMDMGIY